MPDLFMERASGMFCLRVGKVDFTADLESANLGMASGLGGTARRPCMVNM